jgi:predicted dithiol-disulfide oxidoreductase (DUF899 family)
VDRSIGPDGDRSTEEWRKARVKLLELEKKHTRRGDELERMRRELPSVRTDKP